MASPCPLQGTSCQVQPKGKYLVILDQRAPGDPEAAVGASVFPLWKRGEFPRVIP